jgi:hypothetical protein
MINAYPYCDACDKCPPSKRYVVGSSVEINLSKDWGKFALPITLFQNP